MAAYNPPEILTSRFCDLAFIEYDDRWNDDRWKNKQIIKRWNCGTILRGKNFRFTKQISGLKQAARDNDRIRYKTISEIPLEYKFRRKDKSTVVDNISNAFTNSFWFIGALIYHPGLRTFITYAPNDDYTPKPKLFTHFFVKEKGDITGIGFNNANARPIYGGFYGDKYINSVKTHFGWTGGPRSGIVDSLFKDSLNKTFSRFTIESEHLTTDKHFNPNNVVKQFNTDDQIIAEMGIPFLIAGYYDGENIDLYPNIPVYQFLLKDKAAYQNDQDRLARIEAARLARERALIASVVAIHANDAEEPRPLVRDADEDGEDRAAREAANKAVVASIVAINSEEAARQRLAREAAQLAREAEEAEERLAREAEEAARLARELEAEAAVRDAANKAVVASIVAINSEQAAARLAEARVQAEAARQAEAAARIAREEAERLKREAANKAVVASIIAINSEQAARLAAARVQAEEAEAEAARQAEAAARIAREEAEAEAAAEAERLAAQVAREAANNKAVVASIVAINSEQAARLAAAQLAREAERAAREAVERAAREAEEERQAREAARLAREETNKKAVVASIVAINSEQAARAAEAAREGEAEEEEEADEPAPIVNNDSNNIAAIIAAIIQQPRQPLVRVPSSDNKIPSIIAAIMDTTRNHIVRVSELETLLNRLDFLWFINQLKCSEKYKSDEIVRDFTENKRDYNENTHRLTELRDRNTEGSVLYSKYNDELTDLENSWRDDEKNIEYQQYRQSIMIPIQKINIKKDGIELVNQKLQQDNANKQIEDNQKLKIEYANKIIDSEKEHIFCKYYEHTHSPHINELKRLLLQNVNKLLAVPKFKNYTIQDTIYKTLNSEFIYDIFYKIIIKTTIVYDANDPIYIKRELNRDYLNIIGNITNQLRIPNCEKIKFTDQNDNIDYYDNYNTSVLIEGFKKHCERRKLAFYNSVKFINSYVPPPPQRPHGGDDSNSGGDGFESKEQVRLRKQQRLENFNKKKELLSDAKDKAHARTEKNNKAQKREATNNQIQRNLYNNFMRYINNNKILKENMIFYWGSDENKHFEHYNFDYNSEDRLKLTRLYNSQAGLDEEINNFLMDSSTPNLKIKFFIFFCIGFLHNNDVIFYRRIKYTNGTAIKAQFGMDVNNQGEYYNNDNTVKDNILYCTSTGTIPKPKYTGYTDAGGLPDNTNTENDDCKDNCYPTMDVVENKTNLRTGKSAKIVNKLKVERG